MDAAKPFGDESAPTPKQFVLSALCGCTGMDVVGYLKKKGQVPEKLRVSADAEMTDKHPVEFKTVALKFVIDGDCTPEMVLESVRLSQTRFCAVSSMVSRGAPISYEVWLNGKSIGNGEAKFERAG
jgi:putative redox protein